MADISKIQVPGSATQYNIKDAQARRDIEDVKADLDALEEALENVDGLSTDVKTALLACFEHVGWTVDEDERNAYYTALETALHPATVTSISAVYTQKSIVYDTNSLDVLKSELTVTATMSDSTTRVVTGYTLSGTLTAGTSTVTVAYGGVTTTFTVNVTQYSDAETLWINGYADGNSTQEKVQYAPFYLASPHYMMERTKRIVALELKVLTAGTLSIGHELESECIGKLPSQARAGFVLDETITISGTGKKKIYLQTPILLGEGECFAIGATTDTAIFAYGASSPDKKFYYTSDTIVFADASRGLGINVYVE